MTSRGPRGVPAWLLVLASASAIALTVSLGLTDANSVPTTKAVDDSRSIATNDLAPSECSVITVTNLVTGSATFGGTGANDLVIGSSGNDSIKGEGGDDCILGGGGNDDLRGDLGTDVCVGGPGSDTFHPTCEHQYQ